MQDDFEVTRRQFLKLGGEALFLSLVLGTGLAPFARPVFAGDLKVLSDEEAKTLLAVSRTLFPHDSIEDGYYMNVVAAIDAKSADDAKTRELVRQGVRKLNAALGGAFADAPESARTNVLKTMEKSDFFALAYGETLNNLYGNPAIWKMFGYEGSSVEYGGYLERGFDDISWLPKS
ncbi:MAG TPA: gluconate 2-dehydrogenase subunit 3 family protein [Burkholderiales bacterium]|nr:gluconate 2-dehydrogenase subunit 3 family protein [Burkholderiales bacterium]